MESLRKGEKVETRRTPGPPFVHPIGHYISLAKNAMKNTYDVVYIYVYTYIALCEIVLVTRNAADAASAPSGV